MADSGTNTGSTGDPGDSPTSSMRSPTPKPVAPLPTPPDRAHVPFVVPVQIAGYRIVRLIGAGGMGLVYEAVQEALQRRVALKLMQPGAVSGESLARFESEARALARLKHPGIAQVFDTGVYRPAGDDASIVPFLSMELVEASLTLQDFADRAGATIEDKLRVMTEVCAALEHAHSEGVVHRDLKPSNILVNPARTGTRSRSGTTPDAGTGTRGDAEGSSIKIIDFGIAKLLGDGSRTITSRGQIVGTPAYMAPEQLTGGLVDERTDVYSLGVILYQMCTGRLPIEVGRGLDRRGMEKAVCETMPPAPRTLDRRLAGDLETIILKCLQKNPVDRYQNVRDLNDDLAAFMVGERIRAMPDSAIRAARRMVGRTTSRRPLTVFSLCAAIGIAAAMLIATPAMLWYPELTEAYWNRVSVIAPVSGALPDVRVVMIDDETDFEAIAAKRGIAGVSNDNIRSVRLLHGAILERLAPVGPRAVGIDIRFSAPSQFDGPLLQAINHLRERNVGVVVTMLKWQYGPDGLPAIAPEFAQRLWCGPANGGFQSAEIWTMYAVLERAANELMPSFSLLTFAAANEPNADIGVALVENGNAEVRYFKPGSSRRVTLRPPDRILISGNETMTAPDDALGLLPGDIAHAFFAKLPMEGMQRCSFSMQQFFAMSDEELRKEFSNRVVLLGNGSTAGNDVQVSSNGNRIPGVWINAATIQQMLQGGGMEVVSVGRQWAVAIAMSVVAACVGFWIRSWRVSIACLFLLAVASFLTSAILLRSGWTVWNAVPAIAGTLAAGLGAAGAALCARPIQPLSAR